MAEMTSRERLLAAIRFEGPDRVPVSPRFWRYLLRREGTQKREAQLRYAARYDFDPLLGLAAGPVHFVPPPSRGEVDLGPDVRMTVHREDGDRMTRVARTFETPAGRLADLADLPKPGGEFGIAPNDLIREHLVKGPDDLAPLEQVIRAWTARCSVPDFRKASAEVGERGLLCAHFESALSHNAGDAMGLEDFMIATVQDPGMIHRLVDLFHEPLMEMTRQALEQGAECVYCSTFFESISSGWSPEHYRELFLPRIREHVELVHSYGAVYHLYDDGKVRHSLPMMREAGVDLVSTVCPPPSGDVTPAEARDIVGRDVCLNGGIDTVNVAWRGTPEIIDAAVREAIEAAALPEGGYIPGTSDSITEEVSEENFRAFFEAGRRHGTRHRR